MIIYALSTDARQAASHLCNQHLSETLHNGANIMLAVCKIWGISDDNMPRIDPRGMRWTYPSEQDMAEIIEQPWTKWAAESWANFQWLSRYLRQANREFRSRYEQVSHASYTYMDALCDTMRGQVFLHQSQDDYEFMKSAEPEHQPFPRTFGDFEVADDRPTVKAYRDYYKQMPPSNTAGAWHVGNTPYWYNHMAPVEHIRNNQHGWSMEELE